MGVAEPDFRDFRSTGFGNLTGTRSRWWPNPIFTGTEMIDSYVASIIMKKKKKKKKTTKNPTWVAEPDVGM